MKLSILALLAGLLLAGCSSGSLLSRWVSKSPMATIRTPAVSISQTGDAAVPAAVTSTTSTQAVTVPPGATVEIRITPPVRVDPAALPSTVTATTHTEVVTAPQAFTPAASPKPPTAAEEAQAAGIRWFYIGGVVCALAAVACLILKHPVNAGICGIGAVAVPLVGAFFGNENAVRIALAVVGVSGGIWIAWLCLRKWHPEYQAAIKAKADQILKLTPS
jgi:hypothetical protein